MFAAADSLITLLIFAAIAIVSSWLQKKRKQGEQDPWGDGGGPPPPMPKRREPPPRRERVPSQDDRPQAPKPTNWEEELRRLLEGEQPAPPLVVRPQPAPAAKPPPIPKAPLVLATEEGEMDRGMVVELPKLAESAQSYQRAKSLDQKVGEFMRQRAGLSASASAYDRASSLDVRVGERLQQVTGQRSKLPVPLHAQKSSADASAVRTLLADHQSLRSAVLASVVLGPPKSLEG